MLASCWFICSSNRNLSIDLYLFLKILDILFLVSYNDSNDVKEILMFFNIPLSHGLDYYCNKVDTHIKEDFETAIPDYGAAPFNPIGFHFKRNGNSVNGFFRSKGPKTQGGPNMMFSPSTHMHFRGRLTTDKNGENVYKVFIYPQLSQIFMLILSFVFSIVFSVNIAKTYVYVAVFAVVFLWTLADVISLTSRVKKEFIKFLK